MDRLGIDGAGGKSKAGGSTHLLIAHLLDSAAVAGLMWDRYLAASVRANLDRLTGGREGRVVLSLLCGLHDVGKATPAFQSKDPGLAEAVRAAGYGWSPRMNPRDWHHTLAGARIVRAALSAAGWGRAAQGWVWPLVAGHHGRIPSRAKLIIRDDRAHGDATWACAQRTFVDRVASDLGVDLRDLAGIGVPSRAVQLALSGLIVMADWIASDDRHFTGLPSLEEVSMAEARKRAEKSWTALGLRGGWSRESLTKVAGADLLHARFGIAARHSQHDVIALAERMPAPGLLILEAPMGEGKTEAALAAAEVLARRFGADGVFVGMPTQATSDPMFSRVRSWADGIDPSSRSVCCTVSGGSTGSGSGSSRTSGSTASMTSAAATTTTG